MKLRIVSRVLVLSLVVVVGLIVIIHNRLADGQAKPALIGTDLGATAAPAFQLADQSGTQISLRQGRGHPIVLTFLYTHCPDECPLTAEKLHLTAKQLDKQATQVEWLAISVDPVGDSADAARAFVRTHQVEGQLHYLLGSRDQLAPIWQSYHIAVSPGNNGEVTHTGGIYLIDSQGNERVYLDAGFDPQVLAHDLRALLGGA